MRHLPTTAASLAFALFLLGPMARSGIAQILVQHDEARKLVTLADASHSLELRVSHGARCVVEGLKVRGRDVLAADRGAWSGVAVGGKWFTSQACTGAPAVEVGADKVKLVGIRFGGGGVVVEEDWTFTVVPDGIDWRIDRRTLAGGVVDDVASPCWDFAAMSTWTGALLGTGGVAWCKLFDAPNASYGVHTGAAMLWHRDTDAVLDVRSLLDDGQQMAMRFSRQPDGVFSMAFAPSSRELVPKHGHYHFHRGRQDVWAPGEVATGEALAVTYSLRAASYAQACDRGELKGIDGAAVREILNTIARIGVIDDRIVGSNGWYSGYAVLHEPWFALMGLAIDDPDYTANLARSLDYQRDHAIAPDGMVKSRWAYFTGDAQPGTYDARGFYECQWGRLMDTQPSYVVNVAEQFDLSGDLPWVRGQKQACEAALDYLLRRDADGDGLVEMVAASRREHLASDWLDVIWASHENAFVNAQLFRALELWSAIEDLLGDGARAAAYRQKARQLAASFDKPTTAGGFWNADQGWYVYWREADGSVHGDNLTLPVNFMAIAYGLCDDPARRRTILDQVERGMAKEQLFCWPANIHPFPADETGNQPFPTYENGDIFLAWAEVGIRAYAEHDPAIALKFVRSVLARYEQDGLAFQRYLRNSQAGAGDDILANNCSAVVGLYRDIYGVQPRHNRLLLAPHITAELAGTVLNYTLRGRRLRIGLAPGRYSVASGGCSVSCAEAFGVSFDGAGVDCFQGASDEPAMSVQAGAGGQVDLEVLAWGDVRRWTLACRDQAGPVAFVLHGLLPRTAYSEIVDGSVVGRVESDAAGRVAFEIRADGNAVRTIECRPAGG